MKGETRVKTTANQTHAGSSGLDSAPKDPEPTSKPITLERLLLALAAIAAAGEAEAAQYPAARQALEALWVARIAPMAETTALATYRRARAGVTNAGYLALLDALEVAQ